MWETTLRQTHIYTHQNECQIIPDDDIAKVYQKLRGSEKQKNIFMAHKTCDVLTLLKPNLTLKSLNHKINALFVLHIFENFHSL